MLLMLTLLMLGVLLGTRFQVLVLVPVGLLLSAALLAWWSLTESLAWDRMVFWMLCIAALDLGYLLGNARRIQGACREDGGRLP